MKAVMLFILILILISSVSALAQDASAPPPAASKKPAAKASGKAQPKTSSTSKPKAEPAKPALTVADDPLKDLASDDGGLDALDGIKDEVAAPLTTPNRKVTPNRNKKAKEKQAAVESGPGESSTANAAQ